MWLSMRGIVSCILTSFLVLKPWKSKVLQWTLKAKTITIDEITLPMIASTICKSASTLCALKLNNVLANEPKSTQETNKCATWTLDTKDKKADLQSIVRANCKHLRANHQQQLLQLCIKYELLFDSTLGDWKIKLISFEVKEENSYTMAKLSQC
jgi:hypothetical protein